MIRGKFRTLSNISYDAFVQNKETANRHYLFLKTAQSEGAEVN